MASTAPLAQKLNLICRINAIIMDVEKAASKPTLSKLEEYAGRVRELIEKHIHNTPVEVAGLKDIIDECAVISADLEVKIRDKIIHGAYGEVVFTCPEDQFSSELFNVFLKRWVCLRNKLAACELLIRLGNFNVKRVGGVNYVVKGNFKTTLTEPMIEAIKYADWLYLEGVWVSPTSPIPRARPDLFASTKTSWPEAKSSRDSPRAPVKPKLDVPADTRPQPGKFPFRLFDPVSNATDFAFGPPPVFSGAPFTFGTKPAATDPKATGFKFQDTTDIPATGGFRFG